MTEPTAAPPAAPADAPGLIEDFVDIFISPAKVFARRAKEGGTAAFFIVAIVLSGIMYTGKNVMEPIMEAQMSKGMEMAQKRNPQMTAEQMETGKGFQRKLQPIFMVIAVPLSLFFVGVLVWIVAKMFGAQVTFGSSMMIAAYAYIPRIIGALGTDIYGLMADPNTISALTNPVQVSYSPARFMDVAGDPFVLGALMRLDVFTLWVTALIGVAYYSAGKLPKDKAALAAVAVLVIGSLFPLWGAWQQRG